MRTERRAGIAHISFPKERYPDALAPRGPCAFREQRSREDANKVAALGRSNPPPPRPALAVGRTPGPQLDTVNPSIPQRTQRGCSLGRGWGLRVGAAGASSPPSPMSFTLLVPRPPHPPWHLGHLLPRAPACSSFPPHFSSWCPENQILPARHPYELPGLCGALGGLNQFTEGTRREKLYPTRHLELQSRLVRGAGNCSARASGCTLSAGLSRPSGDLEQSLHLTSLSLLTGTVAPGH